MIFECAYNKALLIIYAKQYCYYNCDNVVAYKLPAGTLNRIAIPAIKAVLSLEPLAGRFKGRQGVFCHTGDKEHGYGNKAVRRARVPVARDIVIFCSMMILFYAVFLFCSSISCHRRLPVVL